MAPPIKPIVTPALLAAIRAHPNLPGHTWYFITATTLSVLNRPDEIGKVYRHAIGDSTAFAGVSGSDIAPTPPAGENGGAALPGPEEQLTISRRMREALVKSTAIGGLPKVSCRGW